MDSDGNVLRDKATRPVVGSVTLDTGEDTVKLTVALDELVEGLRWPCGYCNKDLRSTGETQVLNSRMTAEVHLCSHGTRFLVLRRTDG